MKFGLVLVVKEIKWQRRHGFSSSDFWKFAAGTRSWKIGLEDPSSQKNDFFKKKACIRARNTEIF